MVCQQPCRGPKPSARAHSDIAYQIGTRPQVARRSPGTPLVVRLVGQPWLASSESSRFSSWTYRESGRGPRNSSGKGPPGSSRLLVPTRAVNPHAGSLQGPIPGQIETRRGPASQFESSGMARSTSPRSHGQSQNRTWPRVRAGAVIVDKRSMCGLHSLGPETCHPMSTPATKRASAA